MLTEPTASRTYAYDEENRLTSGSRSFAGGALVRLVAVGYDALGRRVKSTDSVIDGLEGSVTVTRHVYSGLAAVEEYTVSGGTATLAREFVWGASFTEPVAMIDRTSAGAQPAGTPEVLHHLAGPLGSVVALTDASGAVVERYVYDPYGRTYIYTAGGTLLTWGSAYGNPYAWTGQRYDAAVGLYHFWARTYSPTLGRWLQRDPLGYVDGVSLYEYVGSGPLTATDPLGLLPPTAILPIAGGGIIDVIVGPQPEPGGEPEPEPEPQPPSTGDPDCRRCHPPEICATKRPSSKAVRRAWEKGHPGEQWPKTPQGKNFDASHEPKAIADGGDPLDPNNIKPREQNDHVKYHSERGDQSRWAKRRWTRPGAVPAPPAGWGASLVTVGSGLQSFFGNLLIGITDWSGVIQQQADALLGTPVDNTSLLLNPLEIEGD